MEAATPMETDVVDFGVSEDGFMPPSMSSQNQLEAAMPALPCTGDCRRELSQAVAALLDRELACSAQWAAELCVSLPQDDHDDMADGSEAALEPAQPISAGTFPARLHDSFMLAKSFFKLREYKRAAHALQHIKDLHKHQAALFVRLYSLYLAGEKRREEEAMEIADPVEKCQVKNQELKAIEECLAAFYAQGSLDGLNLSLYGIALRGLERNAEACAVLIESVRAFPCNWSAWLDIIAISAESDERSASSRGAASASNPSQSGGGLSAGVIPSADTGDSFGQSLILQLRNLPDHWIYWFFKAALHLELQNNGEARNLYGILRQQFPGSSYLLSQVATCHYNMRNFDQSHHAFEEVRRRDPYKLASMDTYSNILYVKEQSAALSNLARQAVKIDKYTPEACCIIGNYYSLKAEHEKSVTYFSRAISLNRSFTPAWILMGHEFMEMKNTPAAIHAYRTAVSTNQRDYRAWYGLGQTYELQNLHFYALFYYKKAMALRPDDARMWCAMAQCYDQLGRKPEALKCYQTAHRSGDHERMALPRLARLHQERGDRRQAAAYYAQIVQQSGIGMSSGAHHGDGSPSFSSGGLSIDAVEALKFLMIFYREQGQLVECEACANRLLDTQGPEKDEAKAMLRKLRSAADVGVHVLAPLSPSGGRAAARGEGSLLQ